ncbi:hypothetical protein Ae201684P_000832 [Aphanomyces euteiches]|uniref:Protein kinase domain-containing protein n=1 Tax=Aphanomyces euteiches TaxID=100861 RepID=A0A6G0XQW2_9STRA|nr:hypothetical protein Ae201684_002307 [Aphanomyces euteiches]KAH9087422.1 hypothetical protein Ae201684P_000832 [Aphanomyces euteiches]KAH9150753.1 hypothetical protein AeRB84_006464 [Aphanomyces euteiches]
MARKSPPLSSLSRSPVDPFTSMLSPVHSSIGSWNSARDDASSDDSSSVRINLSSQFEEADSSESSSTQSTKIDLDASLSSIDLTESFLQTTIDESDVSVAARARSTYRQLPKSCPPTPQRAPQWTKTRRQLPMTRLKRQNSLVATKLLFSLDGESSTAPYFDVFQDVQWIGAGEFSDVYQATAPDSKKYAIKKSKAKLRGRRDRELLLKEIRLYDMLVTSKGRQSGMEYILRYHQAWQEQGHLYIQTELCVGGTLKDYLDSHDSLSEDSCWKVLHDVAAGLSCLHGLGIVHLDIKPANLFLAASGTSFNVKIGDLGLAVQSSPVNGLDDDFSSNEGDSTYMAAELLDSSARHPSADIFSLGLSLMELATGVELPSQGEQWHAFRRGEILPEFANACSPTFLELVKKMLEPSPQERPSSLHLVAHPRVQHAGTIPWPLSRDDPARQRRANIVLDFDSP